MTTAGTQSPLIESLAWGHIRVAGIGDGKDFKLWPGGGREWDWRETGTEHVPGILPADLRELIDRGCRIIVLSRGMQLRLETSPAAREMLASMNIDVRIAETREAAQIYNELARAGEAVGGLFHSTC